MFIKEPEEPGRIADRIDDSSHPYTYALGVWVTTPLYSMSKAKLYVKFTVFLCNVKTF